MDSAAEFLASADRILFTAGAGMSIPCDPVARRAFLEKWPGFATPLPLDDITDHWRYINLFFYVHRYVVQPQPGDPYTTSLALLTALNTNYFVMTSNGDAMFARSGFNPEKIYTPQGDYGTLQCMRACTREVWDAKVVYENLQAQLNPVTLAYNDPATGINYLPKCSHCGGLATMNGRGGFFPFVEDKYQEQANKCLAWMDEAANVARNGGKVAVIEVGVGFTSPGVLRLPNESFVASLGPSRALLIRINPNSSECGTILPTRYPGTVVPCVGLALGADVALKELFSLTMQKRNNSGIVPRCIASSGCEPETEEAARARMSFVPGHLGWRKMIVYLGVNGGA
ncbi:NAD-dependent protein deacetylase of SIR2 family [Pelomyxa schiedti]|nr:NAD-dependent protein deacetylase of SIR2 family [Pelomyxa schiedti]